MRRQRLDDEGDFVLHVAFGRLPNVVRLVRNTAVEVAKPLGYLEQLDDVQLLTSELATNAVRHSHGDITLTVRRRSDAALFLAVGDESPHFPRRRSAALHDERGRGLELLHCLAARWGIASTGHGSKYVWCLLPTPTTPPIRETPA
ncbi:ATP-binding protein [Streptomyces fulvoviolaceus]|uniref:ATP-binding protein n=1 Tax=Streptomyces fulvoviolaceus TaxID=285535 RepID=UPI00131AFDC8|nr:ATP-binding protein [Streptomyces fulvoviolaceus]